MSTDVFLFLSVPICVLHPCSSVVQKTMKELTALCGLVAAVLLVRAGGLASSWDVWMATGDVGALAVGTWLCFLLHNRVAKRRQWQEIGSFIGSPFSFVFLALLAFYLLYNWNSSHISGPRAHAPVRVAISTTDKHG